MDVTTLMTFLGGLGIGSILGALVRHALEQRAKMNEVWLKEYKEAADGFLDAYRAVAVSPSTATSMDFARWEARLQLLASDFVVSEIDKLKNSAPGTPEREQAHANMIAGMRRDLGIARTRKTRH